MMAEATKSGEGNEASEVETWLLIQTASNRLIHLCVDIAQHRGGTVISSNDVEAAWDVLGTLASRLPCGDVLGVDELESESEDNGGDSEAYDPSEDIVSDDDDDDDDDDDIDDDDDGHDESDGHEDDDGEEIVGGWSSEPEISGQEAEETEEGEQALTLAPEMVSSECSFAAATVCPLLFYVRSALNCK